MKRIAPILLGLALAACSSTPTSQKPTASPQPTASSPSPSASSSSPRPGGTPTTRTTATPGTTTTGGSGQHTARLDRGCVRSGVASDEQGITITTSAGGPASYYSFYSDGSSVQEHPEFGAEGQGGGFADGSGTFRDTWTVPAGAPLGRALVRVTVAGRRTPIDLAFKIVAASATC